MQNPRFRCLSSDFNDKKFDDENVETKSSKEQVNIYYYMIANMFLPQYHGCPRMLFKLRGFFSI